MIIGAVFIAMAASVAIVPLLLALISGGHGVKTEGIDAAKLKPATADLDGTWTVSSAPGSNHTSAGFTFYEILPGEKKVTSGSTRDVTGTVAVDSGTLVSGDIHVDVASVTTDSDVRDSNVRRSILHTDEFPEATFVLTQPVDVSQLPGDGSVASVDLTGDLTIHGQTKSVTQQFSVARSGDSVIVAGSIPVKRSDFGVESPDFVAAKIAEEGSVDIRLNLSK